MVNNNPVAMILFNENKDILFGKRSDGKGWCFPGGKSEPGESTTLAAIRETKEETGISIFPSEINLIGDIFTFDELDGVNTHMKSTIYFNKYVFPNNFKPIITEELTEFMWMSSEKALKELNLFLPTRQVLLGLKKEIENSKLKLIH